MRTGFPLLRLPFLPLKATFDQIAPNQMALLYLCSEKTQEAIKTAKKVVSYNFLSNVQKDNVNFFEVVELLKADKRPLQKYLARPVSALIDDKIAFNVYINLQNRPTAVSIYVECKDQQIERIRSTAKLGGVFVPVLNYGLVLYTYWNSKYEGIRILADYFQNNFNAHVNEYFINSRTTTEFSQNLRPTVMWMGQRRIEKCIVNNKQGIKDEDYKMILNHVYITKKFSITEMESDQEVHPNNNWFTLEHLFKTDCEHIEINNSRLSNDDMKEFLKEWVNGRFPNLRKLDVELGEVAKFDHIISGVKSLKLEQNGDKETPESPITQNRFFSHNTSDVIKRKDGLQASLSTVSFKRGAFHMSISPSSSIDTP